jgi:phospholipid transport system substrate-binding protein
MMRTIAFALAMTLAGGAVAPVAAQAVTPATPVAAPQQTPQQIVQSIADELGQAIEGHQAELKNDRPKLVAIINKILLPHFDVQYASLLVLGRYARTATPQQRERFAKAFYDSITQRYAEGLLNYTRGRVQVLPARAGGDERRQIVRTEVVLNDGKKVAVDYVFHRALNGQWQAYDVIIEGISYIANFRSQVGEEIRRSSLDALITRLESQGGKAIDTLNKQGGAG